MIRPLLLTPSLALLVCACGHASTSQQHNSSQTAQQARPAAAQQQSAAPAAETAATAQNETEQATAAQETAGTNTDDGAPPDRGDVSLEHLAALPADAVLPGG